jgi:hypothetical protein
MISMQSLMTVKHFTVWIVRRRKRMKVRVLVDE